MKAINDITQACGNTPLVYLEAPSKACGAHLFAKLEYFNPLGSVKDRVGIAMIEAGLKNGQIGPNTLIVETHLWKYRHCPGFCSPFKGAEPCLNHARDHEPGAPETAAAFGGSTGIDARLPWHAGCPWIKPPRWWTPTRTPICPISFQIRPTLQPTGRQPGPKSGRRPGAKLTFLWQGWVTGGTISGVTEFIKGIHPGLISIAVEPAQSPVLSGGKAGPHAIQGIGAGFIPANLNRDLVDHIFAV